MSIKSLTVVAGMLVLATAMSALAGDATVPKSCQQLHRWQERCRLGPCDVKRIEYWREQCKKDSTANG